MNKQDHDEFAELLKKAKDTKQQAAAEQLTEQLKKIKFYCHGEPTGRAAQRWLIKNLIPEVGTGLASGSWGSGKTFGVLDLAGSIGTGLPFAGREMVRTGGVLFIAAEGGFTIEGRLRGLVEMKLKPAARAVGFTGNKPVTIDLDHLPFVWIEQSPHLKTPTSFELLAEIVRLGASQLKEKFGVDMVLVVIDTLSKTADFDDSNSTSENQKVFNLFSEISAETGAFVLAVNHFGKNIETGTRGPVVKEDSADVVLAFLANRSITGAVSNMRMMVRKLREGEEGAVTPFDLMKVQLIDPITEQPYTTCIVEWQTTFDARATPASKSVPKSLRHFTSCMEVVLRRHGKMVRPFGDDGPEVKAVTESDLRTEFTASYPSVSADTKRKAYGRAIREACDSGLAHLRVIDAVEHIWFTEEEGDVAF